MFGRYILLCVSLQKRNIMKLKKTSAGTYEGMEVVGGFTVTCEASAQDYNGFSYSVFVNGSLINGDGYTGLRLGTIKVMAGTWIVEDAINDYIAENPSSKKLLLK